MRRDELAAAVPFGDGEALMCVNAYGPLRVY
jgi:hypothetical protein